MHVSPQQSNGEGTVHLDGEGYAAVGRPTRWNPNVSTVAFKFRTFSSEALLMYLATEDMVRVQPVIKSQSLFLLGGVIRFKMSALWPKHSCACLHRRTLCPWSSPRARWRSISIWDQEWAALCQPPGTTTDAGNPSLCRGTRNKVELRARSQINAFLMLCFFEVWISEIDFLNW